jgi:hypothetical protein
VLGGAATPASAGGTGALAGRDKVDLNAFLSTMDRLARP